MLQSQFIESPAMRRAGVRHAFFTRQGGVSTGHFSSLNASVSVGDDPASVAENLRRASGMLGLTPERLFLASQVHGREVIQVASADQPSRVASLEADAVASACPDVICAVRTADCVPILLADPQAGVAAAVHAGWRGVELRIAVAAVLNLRALGAQPRTLLAAIGPHIGVGAFEVGPDVAERLARSSSARDVVVAVPNANPRVDLSRIVRAQLAEAGVEPGRIECVGGCTHADAERFYSHRRDGAHSGRLLSAIVPPRGRATAAPAEGGPLI
jgi:YfiH family protein